MVLVERLLFEDALLGNFESNVFFGEGWCRFGFLALGALSDSDLDIFSVFICLLSALCASDFDLGLFLFGLPLDADQALTT